MGSATPDFSLAVTGASGLCPAGERYALEQIAQGRIPVLSCEGACIRGEIARAAANMIASEDHRCARACHAETFLVPHSAMSRWVRHAARVVIVDGCLLRCHGRVLEHLVPSERVIRIDAHRIHRKFADAFSPTEVPELERNEAAREVADRARELLGVTLAPRSATAAPGGSWASPPEGD